MFGKEFLDCPLMMFYLFLSLIMGDAGGNRARDGAVFHIGGGIKLS
jgi:hypothetical protein